MNEYDHVAIMDVVGEVVRSAREHGIKMATNDPNIAQQQKIVSEATQKVSLLLMKHVTWSDE